MDNRPQLDRRRFVQHGAALAAALTALPQAALPRALSQTTPEPAPRTRWQLGCFTRPFNDFSFAQTLDGIARAGYQSVGLMAIRLPEGGVTLANASEEQAAQVAQMAQQRQLGIAATYYAGPPVRQSLNDGITALRKLIDNCVIARCASILLGGTTDETLYDNYYRAVGELCDYAAEREIALTLKPHGGLNATGPQCRQAIERVGHPAFSLWYDPGNIFYYSDGELDPLDDAATVDGLVTGMCIKDFQPPKNVELNPGNGRVDFPGVLKRLHAGGFTSGPLVVETLAAGDLATTIENARQTRMVLEGWIQEL